MAVLSGRKPRRVRALLGRLDLKAELGKILKFGMVGVLSTCAHLGLLWLLLAEDSGYLILKNTLAFAAGFAVSFSGNYFWTFRNSTSPRQAIMRFALVAGLSFLVNTALLQAFHENRFFSVEVTSILIALAVAGMTFVLSRLWAFKGPNPPSPTK